MSTIKHIRIFLFAAGISLAGALITTNSYAQVDTAIKKVGHTGKKIGQKTASVAVKGASAVKDKIYKGKQGPNGETVYIDKKDHKYMVDDKGKKVYLKASEIKDKPE